VLLRKAGIHLVGYVVITPGTIKCNQWRSILYSGCLCGPAG